MLEAHPFQGAQTTFRPSDAATLGLDGTLNPDPVIASLGSLSATTVSARRELWDWAWLCFLWFRQLRCWLAELVGQHLDSIAEGRYSANKQASKQKNPTSLVSVDGSRRTPPPQMCLWLMPWKVTRSWTVSLFAYYQDAVNSSVAQGHERN